MFITKKFNENNDWDIPKNLCECNEYQYQNSKYSLHC